MSTNSVELRKNMTVKEMRVIAKLLKYSKEWGIRKQRHALFFKWGAVLLLFVIFGAVLGHLLHIGNYHFLLSGIGFALCFLLLHRKIFLSKDTLGFLRIEWLMKRRGENKADANRLQLIDEAEKIVESGELEE
ncbi:MAG: hypothetical protein V4478_01370 [Patescibacteria group bacterium]